MNVPLEFEHRIILDGRQNQAKNVVIRVFLKIDWAETSQPLKYPSSLLYIVSYYLPELVMLHVSILRRPD